MKVNEGLSHTQIAKKISKMGFKISKQRVSDLFRNPFYCGYLSHNMSGGELVEGKQEKMVSREIFLRANDLLTRVGIKQKKYDENLPLKKLVSFAGSVKPLLQAICKEKRTPLL